MYSHPDPWNWSVPDFVTTLTTPPSTEPNSALSVCETTLNSCTASIIGGTAYVLRNAPKLFKPSVRKKLLRLVAPLIAGNSNSAPSAMGAAKPPVRPPILFWETLMGATPGVSDRSCVKLRPLRGRSFTCLVSMTVPNSAVDTCNCAEEASTVTISVGTPAASERSIGAAWFTARINSESCFELKLGALTLGAYRPGAMSGNT